MDGLCVLCRFFRKLVQLAFKTAMALHNALQSVTVELLGLSVASSINQVINNFSIL